MIFLSSDFRPEFGGFQQLLRPICSLAHCCQLQSRASVQNEVPKNTEKIPKNYQKIPKILGRVMDSSSTWTMGDILTLLRSSWCPGHWGERIRLDIRLCQSLINVLLRCRINLGEGAETISLGRELHDGAWHRSVNLNITALLRAFLELS